MVKISACLPVYKTEERHLRECIESVLWQTFGDFELLILDDCPEQPVRNIVESYHDISGQASRNRRGQLFL